MQAGSEVANPWLPVRYRTKELSAFCQIRGNHCEEINTPPNNHEGPGCNLEPTPRSFDAIFGSSSPAVTFLLFLRLEGFLRFLEALRHGLIVRSVRSVQGAIANLKGNLVQHQASFFL